MPSCRSDPITGIAAAWWLLPCISFGAYAVMAVLWLMPDKRMERAVREHATKASYDL